MPYLRIGPVSALILVALLAGLPRLAHARSDSADPATDDSPRPLPQATSQARTDSRATGQRTVGGAGGEMPYSLELVPDRLAVQYRPEMPAAQRDAFESSIGWLATRTIEESFERPDMRVMRVSGMTALELERRAAELRANPNVVHATPVYRSFGIDVYPLHEVLVQLDPADPDGSLATVLAAQPLELAERTFWAAGNFRLRITDPAIDSIEMSRRLEESGLASYAQPNYVRRLSRVATPNDPRFPSQWSLDNDAPSLGTKDCDLDAVEGWEITEGCAGVTIAILDEGCDLTHPDYAANLVGGYDFPFDDANASPTPWDAHGTACAGVAAAISNNGLGVAGVASGCRIMPVRIAYSPMPGANWVTTDAWLSNALAWAFTNGADVLSNSWGGGPPSVQIRAAIRAAVIDGCGGRGAVVVFAAGNDNLPSASYPGIYPETICVAATSPCDERKSPTSCDGETWWGSNYGVGIDVSAPGVKIPTTDIQGVGGYDPTDYFATFNGTSSATPHVAGLAALLWCEYPSYKGTEIRARIEQTCDRVGGYAYNGTSGLSFQLGYGRVNVYRALSGKPQIEKGPLPAWPSVYQDEGDPKVPGYPAAIHESAAYEWLGEEYSPEASDGLSLDSDGVANGNGRDGFDDGVHFDLPYLPGQPGQVDVTISVENSSSSRYTAGPLFVNVWFDWEGDGSWVQPHDWVVMNQMEDPSTWGAGANSLTFSYIFLVPDAVIKWRIQNGLNGQYLNVRTRLSYDQPLADASVTADHGEVEDDWFVNFVESFEGNFGNMHVQENCPTWYHYNGSEGWTCHPAFPMPDGPPNEYACSEIYNLGYTGDDFAELRTPEFDFREFTEATLLFDYSAVEVATGQVVLFEDGIEQAVLRTYNHPMANPPCAPVYPEIIDLTPWTGDNMDRVQIAFRTLPGDPCFSPLPNYQDWKIDNVRVLAQDTRDPDPVASTVMPIAAGQHQYSWTSLGDDGALRQAELYNLRINPVAIDASNWRHAVWMQRDYGLASSLTPAPPGNAEMYTQFGVIGGMNYHCVRPLDEVNRAAVIVGGGMNGTPTISAPGLVVVTVGDSASFDVAATDPEFDPLFLFTSAQPAAAKFTDHGDGTGEFVWRPTSADLGDHTVVFEAKDRNGLCASASTTVRVLDGGGPVPGACCFPDGCCQMMIGFDCGAAGGQADLPGTTCSPGFCPSPDPDVATHDTGLMEYSVSSQGTLGFLDESQTDGVGLVYPATGGVDPTELYIAGLWVGADSFYVANRDYSTEPAQEWKVTSCPSGRTTTTGFGAQTIIRASFDDRDAAAPRGLHVDLDSFSWSTSGSDGFVILIYRIRNTGGLGLTGLRAGLFHDFDLGSSATDDVVGSDVSRRLIWMTDGEGNYAGTALLAGSLGLGNLAAVHNPTYIWPDGYVPEAHKFGFLAGIDAAHSAGTATSPDDHSIVTSSDTFDLAPGEVRHVAFAVVVGSSQTDLFDNLDAANTLFAVSDVPGDPLDPEQPGGPGTPGWGAPAVSQLYPVHPNPVDFGRGGVELRLALAQASDAVRLTVHDAMGRRVRSILEGRALAAGEYPLHWDGLDDHGRAVRGGVYFVRLGGVDAQDDARRIVVLR